MKSALLKSWHQFSLGIVSVSWLDSRMRKRVVQSRLRLAQAEMVIHNLLAFKSI